MENHVTNQIPMESTKTHRRFGIRRVIAGIALTSIIIGSTGCAVATESNSNDTPTVSDADTTAPDNTDGNATPETDGTSAENDTPSDSNTTYGVGDTAEYKDVQVTFLNVTESSGSEFNTPSDGNIFVLAEFEITNNSTEELGISSMLSFNAYQDGYSTDLSLSALMEANGQLDGSVAPGKKMKGSVGYEVPADYKELEINLSLDMLSDDKLVFVYNK